MGFFLPMKTPLTLGEILQRAVLATADARHPGSQNRLARRLDVSAWAVSQWALGRSCPTPDREAGLAALGGVSVEELREAIWRERRRQWEARRYRRSGLTPLAIGLLTLSSVLATRPPLPRDGVRPITSQMGGILSRSRKGSCLLAA